MCSKKGASSFSYGDDAPPFLIADTVSSRSFTTPPQRRARSVFGVVPATSACTGEPRIGKRVYAERARHFNHRCPARYSKSGVADVGAVAHDVAHGREGEGGGKVSARRLERSDKYIFHER